MRCYCCDQEIWLARKVKLRTWWRGDSIPGLPGSLAYQAYLQDTTFRWAFLCLACYRRLDNEVGCAEIGDRGFNLAGLSRRDKAAIVNEAKYQAFCQREAAKLGLVR